MSGLQAKIPEHESDTRQWVFLLRKTSEFPLNSAFHAYLSILNIFSGYIRPGVDTNALERNPRLIITNPIILLKLLRNFGHFIRNLGVDFWYLNTKICDAIEIYLAIYCSDSLERFDFSCKGPKKPFENLQKPLKKLKALRLRTHLDQQQNFVQFINESNLPNLQYLYIKTLCDINSHEKIHHKNVEYLTVECIHMNTFPFSFENLKELNFFGNIEVNDAFCKYIGSMKHLKTMKLKSTYNRWSSDLLDKLLQDVPLNVEKIRFGLREENCRKMSIETITHFMKQSRNLRKMSFVLEIGISNRAAEVWLQELSLKLCEEWESYMMDPYKCYKWYKCYVIERKT